MYTQREQLETTVINSLAKGCSGLGKIIVLQRSYIFLKNSGILSVGSSYRILFLVILISFISDLVRSDIYVTLMCNFEVHYQHELFYILKHIGMQYLNSSIWMLNNCKKFQIFGDDNKIRISYSFTTWRLEHWCSLFGNVHFRVTMFSTNIVHCFLLSYRNCHIYYNMFNISLYFNI